MSKRDQRPPQKIRKTFIFIKRGLSADPKHREKMENRVWLYMHILDKADWETGIVHDWKDKDEAADMAIAWRTLQKQRQELEKLGYIECIRKQYGIDIIIFNWVNPRSYSGEVLNKRDQYTDISVSHSTLLRDDLFGQELDSIVQSTQTSVLSSQPQSTQIGVLLQPQSTQIGVPSKTPECPSDIQEFGYSFNKIQRSNDEVADATRLRAEALVNIRGWNDVLVRLAIAFSEESGIALPNPKSGSKSNGRKKGKNEFAEVQKKWRAPLVELFADQCGEDEAFTAQAIRDAVKEMRADDLTISDPNSILKNAKSVAGKKRSVARANGNGNGRGANGDGQHASETKIIEGVTLTTEQHKLWTKQFIELVHAKNNTPQARRALAEQIARSEIGAAA